MATPQVRPPSARAGLAAAVVDGRIYVMGGHDGAAPLRTLEVLEPAAEADGADMWSALPPMLARRAYPTAGTIDGKIFCVGGRADGRTLATFEVFDTKSGSWDFWYTKPPMETKRTMAASAAVGQHLYVVGGFDGLRDLSSVEMYDAESNTWSWRNPLPAGRSYLGLAAASRGLFAVGGQDRNEGESDSRGYADVLFLNFWSERWVPQKPLSVPRIGVGVGVLKGLDGREQVYACGGSDGSAALSSVERLEVLDGDEHGSWSPAPPMGVARLGHAVVVAGNRLYAIGGFDGRIPLDTYEVFDPSTDRWSPLLPMGAPVSATASDPRALAEASLPWAPRHRIGTS